MRASSILLVAAAAALVLSLVLLPVLAKRYGFLPVLAKRYGILAPACRPAADWLPSFDSLEELQASPWGAYYAGVYGDTLQPGDFPVSTADLWIVKKSLLRRCGAAVPWPEDEFCCPSEPGQLFGHMSRSNDPLDELWIYHPAPYQQLLSHQWVEVTHCSWGGTLVVANEAKGAWHYYAPGSGVFFYLGVTQAFEDHLGAANHYGVPCKSFLFQECDETFGALVEAARAAGLDSLQFLGHRDMRCGNTAIEIIDLAGVGAYPCVDISPDSATYKKRYRTGWKARTECRCEAAKVNDCLRCAPVMSENQAGPAPRPPPSQP